MNRTVIRHTTAASISVGLAALVVATASYLPLSPLAYPTFVLIGAVASAIGLYLADIEWTIFFSIWPPWVLALLLDPTPTLAGGLLAGSVGGLLAVPVILKIGNTADSLAS